MRDQTPAIKRPRTPRICETSRIRSSSLGRPKFVEAVSSLNVHDWVRDSPCEIRGSNLCLSAENGFASVWNARRWTLAP